VTNLSGTVTPLPQRFIQASPLLRQRCAERLRGGQVSSLVLAGRDGVPTDPEGGLPSPLAEAEGMTVDGVGRADLQGHPFTPARSLVREGDQGALQLRGWGVLPFSQSAWDLKCLRW
jgi:hypothetical protein